MVTVKKLTECGLNVPNNKYFCFPPVAPAFVLFEATFDLYPDRPAAQAAGLFG